MANKRPPANRTADREELRHKWLEQLQELIGKVEDWAKKLGWSTRRIEKEMEDSQIGPYKAPALMLQKEIARVLMEPIARTAPGTEGLIDLYLLPAYDDIASLSYYRGAWHLQYLFRGAASVGDIRETHGELLTEEILGRVLEEMVTNAA